MRARGLSLLILTLFSLIPPAVRAQPSEEDLDFGRWEATVTRCRLGITPAGSKPKPVRQPAAAPSGAALLRPGGEEPEDCRTVRLDQQAAGLLTLRFIASGAGSRFASRQLTFAGVLEPGSVPMRCDEGRCEPQGILRVRISAVAQSGFDARGLALGLPQASLARGSCLVEGKSLRCQAEGGLGERWRAEANA